ASCPSSRFLSVAKVGDHPSRPKPIDRSSLSRSRTPATCSVAGVRCGTVEGSHKTLNRYQAGEIPSPGSDPEISTASEPFPTVLQRFLSPARGDSGEKKITSAGSDALGTISGTSQPERLSNSNTQASKWVGCTGLIRILNW